MKNIKRYIDFNNYEEDSIKINFKVGDKISPVSNRIYWYKDNGKIWNIPSIIKKIYTIDKIKYCFEIKADGYGNEYKTPCDKGEILVRLHFSWPWFSLEGFEKIN
jgi:hypothetical protein